MRQGGGPAGPRASSPMEKIAWRGRTLTRWRAGRSTFLAWPEKGARLVNWTLSRDDGSVRDVIYWPPGDIGDDFARVRGGNPVLFPFSGRTFDQGDIFFWKDPRGARRPMPLHGLARQADFEVVRADAGGFEARMIPGDEAREAYPFQYEFTVAYRFASAGLSCEFRLANRGPDPIPWFAGWHFYFTLPWTAGARRSDYSIRIPAARRFREDARGRLIPGPPLQPEENMANPGLVGTTHAGPGAAEAVLREKGGPDGETWIRNGTAGPDACFITWTESEAAPYFCVEPWMGPPNAWENRAGLHWVQPGASESASVDVAVGCGRRAGPV